MVTDDDVKKLKTVFATKEDLKRELKKYATKQDLQETTNRLADAIVKNQTELEKVKENMVTKREFSQLSDKLDWIVEEIKENREERLFHQQQHADLRDEIDEIKSIPAISQSLKS